MEQQELTELSESNEILREETPLSNTLSDKKKDDRRKGEGTSELVSEVATGSASSEQATQAAREDVLLFIDTLSSPEPLEVGLPLEEMADADIAEAAPRSAECTEAEGAEAAPVGEERMDAEQMDAPSVAVRDSDLSLGLGQKELRPQGQWSMLIVGLGIAAPAMLGIGSYLLLRYRYRRTTSRKVTQRVARSLQRLAKG